MRPRVPLASRQEGMTELSRANGTSGLGSDDRREVVSGKDRHWLGELVSRSMLHSSWRVREEPLNGSFNSRPRDQFFNRIHLNRLREPTC